MVISLDVPTRRDQVAVVVSPLAELMACLHVLAESDHHAESREWAHAVIVSLDGSTASAVHRFAPLWARYRTRFLLPMRDRTPAGLATREAAGTPVTLADELSALAALPLEVFVPLAANGIRGRAHTWAGADEVGQDHAWLSECENKSFHRGDLAHALVADPTRLRDDLVEALHACDRAFFAAEWEQTRPVLRRAADRVTARLGVDAPADVVASLSALAHRVAGNSRVAFDKLQNARIGDHGAGLLLVPSVRTWPHVLVKGDPGLPPVVQFSVQDLAGATAVSTQGQLRARLVVLSEPGSWELCRHLLGESITTGELAQRTGQSPPAVSRHLRLLREAGLISSVREGRHVHHRMHPAVVSRLGDEVLRAIMR